VPWASPAAFTETDNEDPVPEAGDTLNQLAPSYVKTDALQDAVKDPPLATDSFKVWLGGLAAFGPV
jgi:hypothetical protein